MRRGGIGLGVRLRLVLSVFTVRGSEGFFVFGTDKAALDPDLAAMTDGDDRPGLR